MSSKAHVLCRQAQAHNQELQRFCALVDAGLRFKAVSYQALFSSLNNNGGVDKSYMSYMYARYFRNAAKQGAQL